MSDCMCLITRDCGGGKNERVDDRGGGGRKRGEGRREVDLYGVDCGQICLWEIHFHKRTGMSRHEFQRGGKQTEVVGFSYVLDRHCGGCCRCRYRRESRSLLRRESVRGERKEAGHFSFLVNCSHSLT